MSLYLEVEASSDALVASMEKSWILQDHILIYNTISDINFDFDNVLDALHGAIPDLYSSSFTSKDIVPPKVRHVLVSVLFSKSVQDIEVKCKMMTRQKTFFGCLQITHDHDFLLAILIDGLGQYKSLV